MDSIISIISFKGYGTYIWSAYGIVCGTLLYRCVSQSLSKKRLKAQLRRYLEVGKRS